MKICGAGNPRIPLVSAMAQLNDKDLRIMKNHQAKADHTFLMFTMSDLLLMDTSRINIYLTLYFFRFL